MPTKDVEIGQYPNYAGNDYIQSISEGGLITTILPASGALPFGIPVALSDFALGTGWGAGASISSALGTTVLSEIIIQAGSNPEMSPIISYTPPEGAWTSAPICIISMSGGTGDISDVTYSKSVSEVILTFNGLPVVNETYQITIFSVGAM